MEKPELQNLTLPGSSFEQTMMGWSSGCYIQSFVEIGPPVPKKKILKGFTIYEHGGQHGHFTSIMSSNFHFLVPENFLKKFGSELHSSF